MFLGLIVFTLMILVMLVLRAVIKNSKLMNKLKDKLMWSSVLRS